MKIIDVGNMMKSIYVLALLMLPMVVLAQENPDPEEEPKKKRTRRDTSEILSQPIRYEIVLDDRGDDFHLIENEEDRTILVVQDLNERSREGEEWHYHYINKDLEREWLIKSILPAPYELIGYDYSNGYFFLVFDNTSRYKEYRVVILSKDGKVNEFQDFVLPFEPQLQYLEAIGDAILFVGSYRLKPVVMIHDLTTGKPRVLPGFFNNDDLVFDLVVQEENRLFSVILAKKMRNGKYTNRIKTYTFDGLLLEDNLVDPGEGISLVDGTSYSMNNGTHMLAGTYSVRVGDYSRGIFISKFANGRQRFIKNYNFGDLNNFFAYRGEKTNDRLKRRAARKRAKGKEPRFNFRLYIHDIIPDGDQNLLVAEAYYPRYRNNGPVGYRSTYWANSGFYNPYGFRGFNAMRLLGYKFTHAIVVAFDGQGNILWDNSFRTNDITVENLTESVAVTSLYDRAAIMYLDRNKIKSKVVEGNQVVEGKSYTPVKMLFEGDRLMNGDAKMKGIRGWYDNYLYAYGTQLIRNPSKPKGEKSRRVFYLNKIQFDEAGPDLNKIRRASLD